MTNGRVLMCLLAVLRNSHCQYQLIDLTSTSATCNTSTSYMGCERAIDGYTDTRGRPTSDPHDPHPNCIFTQQNSYPTYWFLNLQQELNIHKITLYMRYEREYTEYLRNVRITADGNEIFKYPNSESSINNPEHITKILPVKARTIKIERTTRHILNYLPLCEVQLWECEPNRYGNQCAMTCSPNCKEETGTRTCDAINGTCFNGCKSSDGKFNSLCTEPSISGNLTGPIVGGLLGAGALIGLSTLLAALITRRRRPPQPPSGDNIGDLPMHDSRPYLGKTATEEMTDVIPADTPTAENAYDPVDTYVNPDDMKVYSALKTTAGSGPL